MRIFERDLFNFIFNPKKLSSSKIFFIKKHLSRFRNELLLLVETLEALESKFGAPTLKKISKKVSNFEEIEEETEI